MSEQQLKLLNGNFAVFLGKQSFVVIVMVVDVVCGMDLNDKTAKYVSVHKGKTYYFCDRMCKKEFDKNPERYLRKVVTVLGS